MDVLFICEKVGAIVYRVRNKARPMMATVGGMDCVAKGRRTKARTIIIRVKDVIITRRLGKIASPPKIITIFTGVDHSTPPLACSEAVLSIIVIKSPMLGSEVNCSSVLEASFSDAQQIPTLPDMTINKNRSLINLFFIAYLYLLPAPGEDKVFSEFIASVTSARCVIFSVVLPIRRCRVPTLIKCRLFRGPR